MASRGDPGGPGAAAHRALRLAHRGDWRRGTENTMPAFRAALANPRCDGLELDVRAAADGTPIVLHDGTLARTHGRAAAPGSLSVAELRALGVPTLAEVLAAAPRRAFLDIELKGSPVLDAPAVIEAARAGRGGRLERTVVSSFEAETLAWLGGERPAWPRWLNAEDLGPATIATAVAIGCVGVSADWRAIDSASMARCRAAGLEVAAWTVRRRPTAARLERLGVVAICVEASALDG